MSPRIQGDGGRLRLEWTHQARSRLMAPHWSARAGDVWLCAYDDGYWQVVVNRLVIRDGHAVPLLDAQLAAEAASVSLLCSALAAFADGAPDFIVMRDAEAWARVNPDDARRLAIALLSASQAVHPGSRPAGEEASDAE